MIILILGPQGSGKGTQARLLAEKFGLFYFEAGAFLRELAGKNKAVKEMIDGGIFVPDAEMSSYVAAFLDEKGAGTDIILDGFPRNIKQYVVFKNWLNERGLKIDLVIVLRISETETIRRLSARRQDPETGKIYNLITDPPPEGVEAAKLIQREDDKPEAIRRRLDWSRKNTEPLIEALKSETVISEIDGERSIGTINKELVEAVAKVRG